MADGQSKQVVFTKWDVGRADMRVDLLSSDDLAAYQMKSYEHFVYVTLASAKVLVLTLPPVSECIGCLYHIYLVENAGGGATLTLEDFKGDAGLSDITGIATADEFVTLYSTGLRWIDLATAGYT